MGKKELSGLPGYQVRYFGVGEEDCWSQTFLSKDLAYGRFEWVCAELSSKYYGRLCAFKGQHCGGYFSVEYQGNRARLLEEFSLTYPEDPELPGVRRSLRVELVAVAVTNRDKILGEEAKSEWTKLRGMRPWLKFWHGVFLRR